VTYYLDLFCPETHATCSASNRTVSGFRVRHRKAAARIKRGDILVCYLTRLSRWVGLLEVSEGPFDDSSPLFVAKDDPFVVRFKVKPLVWLTPEQGIPIHDKAVWPRLSFTREHALDSTTWTGAIRTSLGRIDDEDAKLLEGLLRAQAAKPTEYALDTRAFPW